jgi:hypothetical protein
LSGQKAASRGGMAKFGLIPNLSCQLRIRNSIVDLRRHRGRLYAGTKTSNNTPSDKLGDIIRCCLQNSSNNDEAHCKPKSSPVTNLHSDNEAY